MPALGEKRCLKQTLRDVPFMRAILAQGNSISKHQRARKSMLPRGSGRKHRYGGEHLVEELRKIN